MQISEIGDWALNCEHTDVCYTKGTSYCTLIMHSPVFILVRLKDADTAQRLVREWAANPHPDYTHATIELYNGHDD